MKRFGIAVGLFCAMSAVGQANDRTTVQGNVDGKIDAQCNVRERSSGSKYKEKIYVGKDNAGKDRYMVRYSDKESEDAAVEIYNQVKGSLVIIEGKKGSGSGFVAEADGKKWVYSNEHVSRIGHPLTVTFIDGREINFKGPIQVAVESDLVRMEITDDVKALKIREDAPSIEELVFIFGNSDGGGVITKTIGKVLGVGDDKIEVDAKFVHGNSGSPILDGRGRVVGVATYVTLYRDPADWTKADTRYNEIRRYGMRLINAEWECIDWKNYARAAKQLDDLEAFKDFFLPVCFKNKTIVTEYKAKEMASFKSIRTLSRSLNDLVSKDKQYLAALSSLNALIGKRKRFPQGSMRYPSNESMNGAYNKLHRMLLESLYSRKKALKVAAQFPSSVKWPCNRMRKDAKALADGFEYWYDAYKEENDETLNEIKW